jgi:hypothetical protein
VPQPGHPDRRAPVVTVLMVTVLMVTVLTPVLVAVPVTRPAVDGVAEVIVVAGVLGGRGLAMVVNVSVAMGVFVSGVGWPVLGCGVGLAHGRRAPFRLGGSAGRAVGHRPPLASIMCI